MTVTFDLIRSDKDIQEKESILFLFIFAFLMAIFGLFLGNLNIVHPLIIVIAIVFCAIAFRPMIRPIYSDWPRKKDIIGSLKITESEIQFTDHNIKSIHPYSTLAQINLKYNYIKGRQFAYKDIIHNGLAEMTILFKDSKSQQIKFLINSKQQLVDFKPILRQWYLHGIKVNEIMGNQKLRTIMFEANLSFDKLQQLKEELKVDKFY